MILRGKHRMIDFIAEFIAGLIELLATPWVDKMNKKWKRRKNRWIPMIKRTP